MLVSDRLSKGPLSIDRKIHLTRPFFLARHFDRPLPESSARLCRSIPKRGATRRVSVVNLNTSPWIPGQHLFGAMIPRPEHEAKMHEQELSRLTEKLGKFKSLVESVHKLNGEAAKNERRVLTKLGLDSDVPLSLGYEVVQDFDECDDSSCTSEPKHKHKHKKTKIRIVLTSSNNYAKAFDTKDDLLLETDGISTYEVKSMYDFECEEEEGMEVVGLGRYNTLSQKLGEERLSTRSTDTLFQERDTLLSLMYKSSERTGIAFYRPTEEETMKTDCEEDIDELPIDS
jgi:hypothetical protein